MSFHENFIALDDHGNEYMVTSYVTHIMLTTELKPVYDYSIDGEVPKIVAENRKIFLIKSSDIQIQDQRMIT